MLILRIAHGFYRAYALRYLRCRLFGIQSMSVHGLKIFIGCSSHIDIDNKYIEDAKYISNRLSNKYDLVVGGIQEEGIPGTIYKEFINA